MTPNPSSPSLQAGRDYPSNEGEFRSWFPDDEACLDYLEWLRWPEGFICPTCDDSSNCRLSDGRFWCEGCRRRVSVTSGTIFHRTRTPLTVWFAAAWHMTCAKNGVSAKTLHRILGFGSYQTVWAMLHRFRTAMVRPGRDLLDGLVEADETYVGGAEPGVHGRQTRTKSIVVIAVELHEPKGFGRVRLRRVPDVKDISLTGFVRDVVRPGSRVRTDAWKGYNSLGKHGYHREIINMSASETPAHVLMPGVHRVAAQLKRWLLGTHQGAVDDEHLQGYLDEFAFRFNRRRSEFRGLLFRRLLEQAVQVGPITYRSMVVNGKAKGKKPQPPADRRVAPRSLAEQPATGHPWRALQP
jgi:transposase-like protein